MIRIAIVDNDQTQTELISCYIQQYSQERSIPCHITSFSDGIEIAERYRPDFDVIFLEVETPLMDGIAAARHIRLSDPEVIIVLLTRHESYALRGYEVDALDYILKPVDYYAFRMKMNRIALHASRRDGESLLLSTESGHQRIALDAILYIEISGRRLVYHTMEGDFSGTGSMKATVARLEGRSFCQCDSSYLVNLRYVTWVGQTEVQVGSTRLSMSRPRRNVFLQAVTDYVGGVR